MYKTTPFVFLFLIISLLTNCEATDDRLARSSSPARAEIYDFMNDVRLEVAELEQHYSCLADFMSDTKTYLQSKQVQKNYKITGLYYEKNLDRNTGAHNYADRFFRDGMVMNLVIYPPSQESVWSSLQGINKGEGKQVGRNFVFYQVFTANPNQGSLEKRILEIIERNMEKHAATIGTFDL